MVLVELMRLEVVLMGMVVVEIAAKRIRGRGRRGECRRCILMVVVVSRMVGGTWWANRGFHILVGESFVLGSRRRQRDRRKGCLLKTVNVRGNRWDVDGG